MISRAHIILLSVTYAAFVSLGLPDSILGVAWPAMRASWGNPLEAVGLFTLILTLCSAASGFASARVLRGIGTGRVVFFSGLLTGGALLGFSLAPSFFWLLPLALPLGFGAGSVDAGLNHFAASHWSSRHMSWLHAAWGLGATMGPLIMGKTLTGSGWKQGYALIGVIQLGLAACFAFCIPLWSREGKLPEGLAMNGNADTEGPRAPRWSIWMAPLLFLVYSAVELGTGLWAASILVSLRGIEKPLAATLVSFYYGAIMLGRVLNGLVVDRVGNRAMAKGGIALAFAGAILFALPGLPLALSIAGLALIGLGCAPVYPCLMHEIPRRFDADTARKVIGRQVAFAYLGAAVLPPAFGLLGAYAGLGFIMPAVAISALLLLAMTALLDKAT